MSYQQSQGMNLAGTTQSVEQRDRVKQGGLDIDHDVERHEGSTMNTLSVENLSSSNLDHDTSEVLHRGWEKATDTIAQGVEVVKRLIMQELPPVEGENLKEKAENLKDMASEKVQEVKEKVQEKVESIKPDTEDLSNKASEQSQEVKEKVQEKVESVKPDTEDLSNKTSEKTRDATSEIKRQGQDLQRGARSLAEQTDLYRSDFGSEVEWQPTQQMKDVAREKLGEFKEKYNTEGAGHGKGEPKGEDFSAGSNFQSQQRSFRPEEPRSESFSTGSNFQSQQQSFRPEELRSESFSTGSNFQPQQRSFKPEPSQDSAVLIEQGKEKELGPSANSTIREVESLSHQLNQKVEELKKTAAIPISDATETIIIIQEGGQGAPASQSQSFAGSYGQEQQRPKLGHRDEQQWRNFSSEGERGFTDKISDKAQELKEGFKQGYDKGFEKAGSHMPSSESQEQQRPKLGHRDEQQWRNQSSEQPSEGGQSFAGKLGDKIKEKVSEKATDLKDSYQSNLQELERKSEERRSEQPKEHHEQPKEHHESEHHLTTESQSFKPTAESKSLLQHELLESHPEGSEHHLSASSQSFKPSSQSKSLLQSKLGQGKQEDLGSDLKGKLNEAAEQIKEKVLSSGQSGESKPLKEQIKDKVLPSGQSSEGKPLTEQIKDKVLPSGQSSEGKPLTEQISSKIEEIADKVMPSGESEKHSSHPHGQAPPAEMTETITYHPRDIRGYEIQYVPKHEEEGHESQPKSEEESKPAPKRIAFLDRVQQGFETANQTYQGIKGLLKPSKSGEEGQTEKSSGSEQKPRSRSGSQNVQTITPPAEMKETITYHPRDIKGYEIQYVPKNHEEGEHSAAPKEQFTYHPREVQGYEIEYVPKSHEEGEHTEGEKSESKPVDDRVPLVDRVQHGIEAVRGFFHHSEAPKKESLESKVPEGASELSKILESQAEVLKTKYSALRDDQPHGEELVKSQPTEKSHEGQEHKGLFSKVSGAIHNITDKFSHGGSNLEGKVEHTKEEPKKAESPREKIYEFNPKAKKAEEKPVESEEKPSAGFMSKMSDRLTHGFDGVKERFHSGKEETEKTSTEKNQSVFEKIQGKIQGKETGEEVDKEGFRKVHDGFSETVDELNKEHNEPFHEQLEVANENPFEPLRTKQAALIDHPVTSTELVGGNLKEMTSHFDENEQEMIPEDKDEEKRGLFQKVKQGIFSKLGRGDKENEESA